MSLILKKTAVAFAVTSFIAFLQFNAAAQTNSDAAVAAQNNANGANNALLNTLIRKGILTEDEAKQIQKESDASQANAMSNAVAASKWKLPDAIKSIGLYGDLRLRYEYRGVDNVPGLYPNTFERERFRYALRLGIKGEMTDNINYGVRLETSTNPRSPWVTFGDDSNPTPSDKHSDAINVGQIYIGWHPCENFQMTVGRMPMPLYTTPMVWDSDINPEGAFEKFSWDVGDTHLFADFGQFDYQNPSSSTFFPSSDVFLLAWQAGAKVDVAKDMYFEIAPVLYNYTGVGSTNGANLGLVLPYTGQGQGGVNVNFNGGSAFNQNGINDLLVLEIPAEYDFPIVTSPLGKLQGRFFGDFAYNLDGKQRAETAASVGGLSKAYTDEVKAYQIGFGVGSGGPTYGPTQGLVYGTTSKKYTWEARAYWQHVEQYALDVNLLDSDFFEGRANLEGYYLAFAYSLTDSLVGTLHLGYAQPINTALGTGGNNLDIPGINPINHYRLLQLDLALRF
jgi:hypothetical protein